MGEPVTVRAPGKVILFGEHAINRGQSALSASVGLYATCRLALTATTGIVFRSDAAGHEERRVGRAEVLDLGRTIDRFRAAEQHDSIREIARTDFFGPQQYILASAFGESLPDGLEVSFHSQVPRAGGLGSGGAAFASLATALAAWTGQSHDLERIASWAHRGDIVAHGGIASRLDTQTSLRGGVIRFTAAAGLGEPVPVSPGLTLVIGNTRVTGATGEVNTRVRRWLAERPAGRIRYFEAIGSLTRDALSPLAAGDWPELGRLMTLNQLVLEKIGVSSPALERLIAASLDAGAYGAKLAGSGGGGCMVALTDPQTAPAVAAAIEAAGGEALRPALAVPGAVLATTGRDGH